MKLNRTLQTKAFFGIVAALLLALVLQPSAALADDPALYVTYLAGEGGTIAGGKYVEKVWDYHDETWGRPKEADKAEAALVPDTGYEFDYWITDSVLVLWDRNLPAGSSITTADILNEIVYLNYQENGYTFTAHFKKTSGDTTPDEPDTDPVDPADTDDTTGGSSTVEPADSTTSTLPKTGDVLPGVGVIVLTAAALLAAATAILRKKNSTN